MRRYVLMITAPLIATSVSLLVLGGAAAWYVHSLNQELSDLLACNLECTVSSQQIVLGLRDVRNELHRFIEGGEVDDLSVIDTIKQTISQHLRDAEETATTTEIRALVAQTRRGHDEFFANFAVVTQQTPLVTRRQMVRELVRAITTDVISPAERLLEKTQQAAVQHTERNRSLASSIGLGLFILGICGAVGGLMAGYGIAQGIARRIEQSEREATRSEQLAAIGQLAAGLAHELRNPLTAMRILVDAGGRQSDGNTFDPRDLEVLDEEIGRMERLVESFLDFARPPHLEKATIDARSLVDQTLRLVSGPAHHLGVTIDWRPPAEVVTVEADPVQMRQVLLNLLLNAMEATGESGKITVELDGQFSAWPGKIAGPSHEFSDALIRGPESPPCSLVHVSDNGPGIPDEMKERIFQPFVTSKETGIGLGLAVSQRIVEAHGGTIRAADNPGGGARFTVCLPRGDEHPGRPPSLPVGGL